MARPPQRRPADGLPLFGPPLPRPPAHSPAARAPLPLGRPAPAGPTDSSKPVRLIVNVDGGARGNPGPAASGVVVSADDGTVLLERGIFIGHATNNVAEYRGLVAGLEAAASLGAQQVEVVSDSELLVRQMNGQYRVRNAGLKPLYDKACSLARRFRKCAYRHVRREQNTLADKLVNLALDQKRNVDGAD